MARVNIAGYTVSANPTAPNSLFEQDGGGGQGVTFVPKLTETSRGYELSWTNDGGLPNPDPVEITNGTDGAPGTDGENGATFIPSVTSVQGGHRLSWTNDGGKQNPDPVEIMNGTDGAPGIDGENGATFIPSVTSVQGGHKLSWTNDGGLPNPPDVTILDGHGGEGGGILEEFTPSTWAEALKTVAIAVTESASFDISGDIVYHTLRYEFSDYDTRIQSDEETHSGANVYIEPLLASNVKHFSLTKVEVLTDVLISLSDTFNTRAILEINSGKVTAIRIGTYPITSASLSSVNDVREIFLDEEITLLPNTPPSVKLYRFKT